MQINIKEKNVNPLLNRTEVKGKINFEGATPSNNKLIEALSKEFNSAPELVIMKQIANQFSKQEAKFLAYVYKDTAARDKIEMMTKHLKKKIEEDRKKKAEEEKKRKEEQEKKKAEEEAAKAAAAEKKEEAPAEEVKEGEQ